MSRAWSLGKTDRCKLLLFLNLINNCLLNIVKMDAPTKKNLLETNVAPGTYERTLKDKKDEPKWRYVSDLADRNLRNKVTII
jgi:hypothetical protein